MDSSPKATSPLTSGSKEKKRSIWFHLHFWIGWISAVPVALVCLTGALLAFEKNIIEWESKEFYHLEATGAPLSIDQILEVCRSANPSLQVAYLGMPESPHHAYAAYATEIRPEGNQSIRIFINPYTGMITKRSGNSLADIIKDVHRHLAAGKAGQQVVGISSLVLAITAVIGLVLWWPLRGRTFVRAWKRGQALDWHNALGLVALLPLIVLAITGITFTWGRNIFPLLERMQGKPSQVQRPVVTAPASTAMVSIDRIVEQVRTATPDAQITGVLPSNGKKNPLVLALNENGKNLQIFVDPYTGKELQRSDGSGTGPVGWYRKNFGKFHTLGGFNYFIKTSGAFFSAVGTVLVITGMWISVKRWRRPKRGSTQV